jgi:hypothetical protein
MRHTLPLSFFERQGADFAAAVLAIALEVDPSRGTVTIDNTSAEFAAVCRQYRAAASRRASSPPKPPKPWPLAARTVAKLRRDGETGVGDTLARLIGSVKGDRMARWYTRMTGRDCGCADGQAALNQRYPYPPPR